MTPKTFRAIVERTGLSQAKVAARLGVNPSTVSRWLRGLIPITEPYALFIRHKLRPKK
jgi:transcriptional regulator with XRE-family HTH domain